MVHALHRLSELVTKGGCVHAECRCGRVTLLDPRELLALLPMVGPIPEQAGEFLRLLARGHSNREIARELYISELTAKTHVSRILTKLNLLTRVHAVVFAYETGLVTPGTTA